ncbi:YczE/YyaS/YitT family protein [Trueperella sp. LYQ143]|uniref:YczE/YyaS/YitT family protein n=1 Tax=unclassified Trueperella TaxID=2630174 RepID=UPI003982EAF1
MLREIKNIAFFTVGITFLSLGIALLTLAGLGTSPIGSPMWALYLVTGWSFGTWNFIICALLVVLQWALLRKDFPQWYWVQVPLALLQSVILDGCMAICRSWHLTPTSYPLQILQMIIAVAIMALGIACEVSTKKYFLPTEGILVAVSQVTRMKVPTIKVCNDVIFVLSGLAISFLFLSGIEGVREGTLVAAIMTGVFVGWMQGAVDTCYRVTVGSEPDPETV